MLTMVKIELFNDNLTQHFEFNKRLANHLFPGVGEIVFGKYQSSFFVAEIIGVDYKYTFKRLFINGKKDYSNSNSKGSRGIFMYYFLDSSKIYDIKRQVSWKKTERFYCKFNNNGEVVKITEDEVFKCIKST